MSYKYLGLVLPLLLWQPDSAIADSDLVDVHGFVTQGYFRSNSNDYFGPSGSTTGSFDFYELGLLATKDFETARLSGLLLARKAGGTDNGHLRVDHLTAAFDLHRGDNYRIGLELGRLKTPIGLYNQTRDTTSTRPSILLPQSIYFDNARQFLINADGGSLFHESWTETTYTKLELELSKVGGIDNPETEAYFLGTNWPGHLSSVIAEGVHLYHTRNNGRTVFSAFISNSNSRYQPAAQDLLTGGTLGIRAAWLSLHQDFGANSQYGITSEVFLPRIARTGFGPVIPDSVTFGQGFYVQGEWRATAKLESFIRHDVSYLDRSDKDGTKLAALTGRPAHAFFAKDWTLGARYHITPRLAASAEIHRVNGTAWLPLQDNPISASTRQHWTLFAAQLSWGF